MLIYLRISKDVYIFSLLYLGFRNFNKKTYDCTKRVPPPFYSFYIINVNIMTFNYYYDYDMQ